MDFEARRDNDLFRGWSSDSGSGDDSLEQCCCSHELSIGADVVLSNMMMMMVTRLIKIKFLY